MKEYLANQHYEEQKHRSISDSLMSFGLALSLANEWIKNGEPSKPLHQFKKPITFKDFLLRQKLKRINENIRIMDERAKEQNRLQAERIARMFPRTTTATYNIYPSTY